MNELDWHRYETLIFDCDGVIFDSNSMKTAAFYTTASQYGEAAATRLVKYHRENGGVSRQIKFRHFLQEIVGIEATDSKMKQLLDKYAKLVRDGLMTCRISNAIRILPNLAKKRCLVISGGDQEELRQVFHNRAIGNSFNGGIFGSPESKETIFKRELSISNIKQPAIFFGDSKYDHKVAREFGVDFVFVSDWTDFHDWKSYVIENNITNTNSLEKYFMKNNNVFPGKIVKTMKNKKTER